MPLISKLLASLGITIILFAGGWYIGEKLYTPQPVVQTQSFGNFTPVGGQTYTLSGSGVIATATTIPLTSFTTPDGRALTMSNFGSIGYAVMDPNSPTRIEDITFTGITQNTNGTAVLTGVSRGMDFVSPYMASTTLAQPHAGGSYFILSNSAGFYGQQFFFLNNPGVSTAILTFGSTTPPKYDADPIWANFSTQVLADVSYVNSVVAAGAANGSETVKGIYQLATAAQAALSTSLGSTGARLALGANLATSTPGLATVTGDIPTLTGSFLNQVFLNLTQAFTFSTTTQYFANIGTLTATTSARLPANTTAGGLPILTTSYVPIKYTLINTTTFNTSNGTGNGTVFGTSTDSLTIPAGVFAASSTIAIFAANNDSQFCNVSGGGSATCTLLLRDSLGDTLASVSTPGNGTSRGTVNINIFNQNNTSSQKYITSLIPLPITAAQYVSTTGSAAVNTSGTITLFLVTQISNSGVGSATSFDLNNFSIVVTP